MEMTSAVAVDSNKGSRPRLTVLCLLAATFLFAAFPTFATNTQVGGCKPASIPNFPTISLAVASASSGGTVFVCPGQYQEQVFITKPLTLIGVISGNSSQAIIEPPTSGLATVTDPFGNSIAAMVTATTGPVKVENITVDGTGNTVDASGGLTFLVGIYYASGSSGTAEANTARNLYTPETYTGNGPVGFGVGIWAENGSGTTETVDILNNSIHDFDFAGILTFSTQTSLFADIIGNTISQGSNIGISWGGGVADKITGNVISMISVLDGTINGDGIDVMSLGTTPASVTVSNNVVAFTIAAINATGDDETTLTVLSNQISNSSELGIGIQMGQLSGHVKGQHRQTNV